MATEIKAGSMLEFSCPAGSTPVPKVGDVLNVDGKPAFAVIRIEGAKVTLGPMRGLESDLEIKCLPEGAIHEKIKVTVFKDNEKPKPSPPVLPFALSYPLWFWLCIVLVIAAIAGGTYWFVRRRNAVLAKKKRKVIKVIKSPDQSFAEFLQNAVKAKWTEDSGDAKADEQSSRLLYFNGNDVLRNFLQYVLHFDGASLTTTEFLGALKISFANYQKKKGLKTLGALPTTVESCLIQADQVRFAGERPDSETRKNFLKLMNEIQKQLKVSVADARGDT